VPRKRRVGYEIQSAQTLRADEQRLLLSCGVHIYDLPTIRHVTVFDPGFDEKAPLRCSSSIMWRGLHRIKLAFVIPYRGTVDVRVSEGLNSRTTKQSEGTV
jgi:hypothetical protein